MKSYAVPGQHARPALDRALAQLEAQADTGICPVCGLNDPLKMNFGGRAFFHRGRLTPWMCPDCAAAWLAAHPDTG